MGHAQGGGGGTGVMNVLPGAAGTLPLDGGAMVVELEGHADHVVSCPSQQGGGHGGVHAPGHGGQHPGARRQAHGPSGLFGQAIGKRYRGHGPYLVGPAGFCERAATGAR